MIAIFVNILVVADSYPKLLDRLRAVLLRCKEYNIFLKCLNSYIGYRSAKFIGYEVSKGQYKLTPDRLAEIDKIPSQPPSSPCSPCSPSSASPCSASPLCPTMASTLLTCTT